MLVSDDDGGGDGEGVAGSDAPVRAAGGSAPLDPLHSGVLVVLNAAPTAVTQPVPRLRGQAWELAGAQRDGADPVVRRTRWDVAAGAVTVPALTAAVLVRPRAAT